MARPRKTVMQELKAELGPAFVSAAFRLVFIAVGLVIAAKIGLDVLETAKGLAATIEAQ